MENSATIKRLNHTARIKPEETNTVNYRIKPITAVVLVFMALFVDLLEFLITWLGFVAIGGILSTVLSIVAGFTFWLIFLLLGINASANTKSMGKRIILQFGTFIAEIIPFFDAIPLASFMWTIGMIITIFMTWQDDRGEAPSYINAVNQFGKALKSPRSFLSGFRQ